jgi:hypothetical protein
MDSVSADWYREAAKANLGPLGDAESDFSAAYRGGTRASIAQACEHLRKSALQSKSWRAIHPCPSLDTDLHLKSRVEVCRWIVEVLPASPVREDLADRVDFRVADLQHRLLWHRDAIAAWAAKIDE